MGLTINIYKMNELIILTEGSPIIPYQIQVNLAINATCNFIETVASPLNGTELNAFFAGYVENAESVQKTHPEFTTQDGTRNATFNLDLIGVNAEDSSKNDYTLTYSFAVNGIATIYDSCQSNATGEDFELFKEQKKSQIELDWYSVRPQWTKNN
jgi:hypothetical protein